jgi:hypothetical protein
LKGNFLKVTITNQATGQSVAEIKKKSWTLKTEYHITVAAGVDLALVVSLCLILHDRQGKPQELWSRSRSRRWRCIAIAVFIGCHVIARGLP